MKNSTTAKRLSEYLHIFDLRQVDILERVKPYCEEFGVKIQKSELSQYINGKFEPGNDKLYVLSVALGVNPLWLMGYDEPMYKTDELATFKPDKAEKETPVTESDDELDLILKQLLLQLPEKRLNKLLRLSPASLELLLEYADFLAERESNGSSGK